MSFEYSSCHRPHSPSWHCSRRGAKIRKIELGGKGMVHVISMAKEQEQVTEPHSLSLWLWSIQVLHLIYLLISLQQTFCFVPYLNNDSCRILLRQCLHYNTQLLFFFFLRNAVMFPPVDDNSTLPTNGAWPACCPSILHVSLLFSQSEMYEHW